eukprot:TRINITY_DN4812_c0_g1_i3.p1 TRINITY_DN4812_c0_g1~~TRINITY_DN4812_c0_g1_i3.p1  ORF type:complete len:216 (+),score=67.22 TRINITY_DN4812_c0_g1_i3:293-940(+)
MRRCLSCIPILTGAVIVGLFGLGIALAQLVLTVAYLVDFKEFNPIGKNINTFYYLLEKSLADQGSIEHDEIDNIISFIRSVSYRVILGESILEAVFALVCLLLLIGIYTRRRWLLMPYLLLTMILIVLTILSCFLLTGLSFLFNPVHGGIALFGTIVVVFMSIYIWAVVQRAYVTLGRRGDYVYTPASSKGGVFQDEYYPTAPQHFQMTETDKRM